MKTLLTLLSSLLLAGSISSAETKEPGQPLDISIAASRTEGEEKILACDKTFLPAFDVVITNISPSSMSIWNSNTMWGFCCLSLEYVDTSGKSRIVTRNQTAWDSNWPRPFFLKPGDHFIFRVTLGDGTWPVDWLKKDGNRVKQITLRPIYEIPPHNDPFSKNVKVWLGKAEGKAGQFRLMDY